MINQNELEAKTRLTKTDLRLIEQTTEAEIEARLGTPPELSDLEDSKLSAALDGIRAFGSTITMLASEILTAIAPLLLILAFGLLEAERIYSGARVLGQDHAQGMILAAALVAGNVIVPIYSLRELRGKRSVPKEYRTLRGQFEAFVHRLIGKPETREARVSDNPTLKTAKAAILWATIGLAVLAVLGPMLQEQAGQVWYTAILRVVAGSDLSAILELVSGILLSVGGVMFVQSAAFELGIRAIIEAPESARKRHERALAEWQQNANSIRDMVKAEYMAGKVAERERKRAAKLESERIETLAEVSELGEAQPAHMGGNGHHNGNGKGA